MPTSVLHITFIPRDIINIDIGNVIITVIFKELLFLQNLSTWKNRRRKQSEEALQRVSEVKALEDDEFGTTKKS